MQACIQYLTAPMRCHASALPAGSDVLPPVCYDSSKASSAPSPSSTASMYMLMITMLLSQLYDHFDEVIRARVCSDDCYPAQRSSSGEKNLRVQAEKKDEVARQKPHSHHRYSLASQTRYGILSRAGLIACCKPSKPRGRCSEALCCIIRLKIRTFPLLLQHVANIGRNLGPCNMLYFRC